MACVSAIAGLVSGGIQGIGSLFTADQAKQAATDAGNIESKGALQSAATQAAGLTRGAQTASVGTLAGGQTTANALLAGGRTAAAGYDTAINGARGQFGVTQNALNPYLKTGAAGASLAANLLGGPNNDPAKMQAALAATPGYQFALTQGLKATQAGFAAKGLGSSGAALRGAADYTTGLASQTYGMIFNQAMSAAQTGEAAATTLSSANTDFMHLLSTLQTGKSTVLGESQAAAGGALGAARTTSGNILGSAQAGSAATLAAGQLGSANALAAGKIGSSNAITAGLNSMFSAFGNSALLVGNSGIFKSPANNNNLGAGTNYVGGIA